MAKYYGDIPCMRLQGKMHITSSGTKCLCGKPYQYGAEKYRGAECHSNIVWRELSAVNCDTCRKQYIEFCKEVVRREQHLGGK